MGPAAKYKNLLLGLILLVMLLPLLQDILHFKKYVRPLDGAFKKEPDTSFTWAGWFSGTYQDKKEKFARDNFGFHDYYIRSINQVDYWLFKTAGTAYVIVGKDDYLYETAYLEAYNGSDFSGKYNIQRLLSKLKCAQLEMKKQNKLLLVVFAAGKASFYPEHIPSQYKRRVRQSNYSTFVHTAKELNLDHIDFNAWLLSKKHTSRYPLYPQLGIHWSNYASTIAFDSILKYIEHKCDVNLPDLSMKSIVVSDSLRDPDDDAVKSLNLWTPPVTFPMAYPECSISYDPAIHRKLRLLVISDSFWWHIYATELPAGIFSSARFWYYNKEAYPESYTKKTLVTEIDKAKFIREADVVLIMHSEANMSKFGGGITDDLYETYCAPGYARRKISRMKHAITSTPEWMLQVKRKAAERGISLDSMLTLDAIFTLQQVEKNKVR
jgi:hypothetical protein